MKGANHAVTGGETSQHKGKEPNLGEWLGSSRGSQRSAHPGLRKGGEMVRK